MPTLRILPPLVGDMSSHSATSDFTDAKLMATPSEGETRASVTPPAWGGIVRAGAVAVMLAFASGCASVARITTLSDVACREALAAGFVTVLTAQAETPATASHLAREAVDTLASVDVGPRPFLVVSPSGTDYAFFVERKDDACLLRLYGRQKGFVSYTNNVTYIATQPLAPCRCAE